MVMKQPIEILSCCWFLRLKPLPLTESSYKPIGGFLACHIHGHGPAAQA